MPDGIRLRTVFLMLPMLLAYGNGPTSNKGYRYGLEGGRYPFLDLFK